MDICYLQFYVKDATYWRTWFVKQFYFQPVADTKTDDQHTIILTQGGATIVLSSPQHDDCAIANYLNHHPPGLVNVAFEVSHLEATVAAALAAGMPLLEPIQTEQHPRGLLRWCQVQGWGTICHTLVERCGQAPQVPGIGQNEQSLTGADSPSGDVYFLGIDHAVINVARGELQRAIAWYEEGLGFQQQQSFTINTQYSGLASQVLRHPTGTAQLPINEPTSTNSQIQEFLDYNQGAGVQHVALATQDLVTTLKALRSRHLEFLSVPQTYYEQLHQRPGFREQGVDWEGIATQQILVDWPPDMPQAILLQTFTQPIFGKPTFFFEIIERYQYEINDRILTAQGFGEGNFQALFEAMEREQRQRGSL
ncbi:MAG: 4-hydroxyphenylpyruvate dioxygenase [Cyanobacteria bacterium P01_A01_bin.123]